MRLFRALCLASLCLGVAQCETPTVEEGGAGASAEVPEVAQPRHGPKPRVIQLARVQGYGNPQTGELWVKAASTLEGIRVQNNGVQAAGEFALGLDKGYCDVTVANDGVRNSNPPGTWEFYTADIDGMQTTAVNMVPPADASDDSSFNAATCLTRVSPAAQGANDHSGIFSGNGAGCALQHVGNFTGLNFANVYLDVDVFNGSAACSGPYGPPWGDNQDGTGSQPTPATIARNEPQALDGLWNFGPMNDGDTVDMWIFFQNCISAVAFDWTGFLLAEVVEECGNATDDDCDGVINNGCQLIADGASCYTDGDCSSSFCAGAVLTSGIGMGGATLMDDIAGTCYPATCRNATPDGDETDVDCGGSCGPCSAGQMCLVDGDCRGSCNGANVCYAAADCGNGSLEAGEECDDGPGNNHDNASCKSDCSDAFCGDGLIDCTSEGCDGGGNCSACMRIGPETFTFTGALNGSVGECLNYAPFGVPAPPDTVIFDGSSPSASVSAAQTVSVVHLQSTYTGTLTLSNNLGIGSQILVDGGTLDLGGVPPGWYLPSLLMSGAGTVNAGAAQIIIGGNATFTPNFNAGTSVVNLEPGNGDSIGFGGATFDQLRLVGGVANPTITTSGAVTTNELYIGDALANEQALWSGNANFTVTGPMQSQLDLVGTNVILGGALTLSVDGDVTLTAGGNLTVLAPLTLTGVQDVHVNASHIMAGGVTVTGAVTLSGGSTFDMLTVDGTVDQNAFDLIAGDLIVNGTLDQNGADLNVIGDFTINGGGVWDGGTGFALVGDDFFAGLGSLPTAPATFLSVGDDFNAESTFVHNGGLVDMTNVSMDTRIEADNVTFNDLTLSDPTGAYRFDDEETFTVAGTFDAQGMPGDTLTIKSDDDGLPFAFNPAGTVVVNNVSVRDSTNLAAPINPASWTNLGNTVGWGPPPPTHGYFVITDDVPDANFGGLAGADALCLSSLQVGSWMGKPDAINRGMLNSSQVRAWLCVNAGCENLQPNTDYQFASVPNPGAGGAQFTSTFMGLGPGDSNRWDDGAHFGNMGGEPLGRTWTGRASGSTNQWADAPTPSLCNDWTALSTGSGGRIGTDTGTTRWNAHTSGCSVSTSSLICMVDPTPRPASLVLGQADFVSGSPSTSDTRIDNAHGVVVDPTTGKVFVVDTDNNRVLRFASIGSLTNGAAAEGVLGQTNFTNSSPTAQQNRMFGPRGLIVDTTGTLWVADYFNHRVLRFDGAAAKADGANADGVLGQTNFTNAGSFTASADRMNGPAALTVDASGTLWVAEKENNRVLRFDNAAAKADGANADGVLGQLLFTTGSDSTAANRMHWPRGLHIDGSGRLWVTDGGNNRVLRFDSAAGKADGANADGVLGQPDFISSSVHTTADGMSLPRGIAADPTGRVYVSDHDNNRILYFDNAAALADGSPADGVFGQPTFLSGAPTTTRTGLRIPNHLFYDPVAGVLWAADSDNNRVLAFDQLP